LLCFQTALKCINFTSAEIEVDALERSITDPLASLRGLLLRGGEEKRRKRRKGGEEVGEGEERGNGRER